MLKAHPKILSEEENKYLHPVFNKAMYVSICASDLKVGLKHWENSIVIKNEIGDGGLKAYHSFKLARRGRLKIFTANFPLST